MRSFVLISLLILCVVDVALAEACTCGLRGAPCDEFWRVSAVFVGTVRAIRRGPEGPGALSAEIDVDMAGRGVNSKTVVVEHGGNCGYAFQVGQRYIVYAHSSPSGRLTTNMCTGTKPAAAGAADLAFLKEVTGRPRSVRLFGHLKRVEEDLISPGTRDYGTVAGARVQVTGAGTSLYHEGWRAVCPWPGTSFKEAGKGFGAPMDARTLTEEDARHWELYHLEKDFAENHNPPRSTATSSSR